MSTTRALADILSELGLQAVNAVQPTSFAAGKAPFRLPDATRELVLEPVPAKQIIAFA